MWYCYLSYNKCTKFRIRRKSSILLFQCANEIGLGGLKFWWYRYSIKQWKKIMKNILCRNILITLCLIIIIVRRRIRKSSNSWAILWIRFQYNSSLRSTGKYTSTKVILGWSKKREGTACCTICVKEISCYRIFIICIWLESKLNLFFIKNIKWGWDS